MRARRGTGWSSPMARGSRRKRNWVVSDKNVSKQGGGVEQMRDVGDVDERLHRVVWDAGELLQDHRAPAPPGSADPIPGSCFKAHRRRADAASAAQMRTTPREKENAIFK